MNSLLHGLAGLVVVALLSACGASRTAFTPESGPPTVGMPAELSEREREYIPGLDAALRNQGFLPVLHGAGDYQLDFKVAEGPINTDTTIELHDPNGDMVAEGHGRGSGAPMIGRSKVAERSFQRAFEEFQSALPGSTAGRSSGASPDPGASDDMEYVY